METSENGQKFDADIQVSAGKRSLSFSPPSEAIKQSIDTKTAKDLGRASDQLEGTFVGTSTTKNNLPVQKQKKSEAKKKGIEPGRSEGPVRRSGTSAGAVNSPEAVLKQEGATEKKPSKGQSKNKKAQKDQGLSV